MKIFDLLATSKHKFEMETRNDEIAPLALTQDGIEGLGIVMNRGGGRVCSDDIHLLRHLLFIEHETWVEEIHVPIQIKSNPKCLCLSSVFVWSVFLSSLVVFHHRKKPSLPTKPTKINQPRSTNKQQQTTTNNNKQQQTTTTNKQQQTTTNNNNSEQQQQQQ